MQTIKFRRMPWYERALIRLSPRHRRVYEAKLRDSIRFAFDNPHIPCEVEGIMQPTPPDPTLLVWAAAGFAMAAALLAITVYLL
jgi:hypothetical protein